MDADQVASILDPTHIEHWKWREAQAQRELADAKQRAQRTCRNCQHAREAASHFPKLHCHRRAPASSEKGCALWPEVRFDDDCGEFTPKKD